MRALTDATGAAVNEYRYDSYGRRTALSEDITQPYGYTGHEFDAESGLAYYRARYYDADSGRFLSEDPLGFGAGDLNLYRYVFGNPANLTDPTGMSVAIETGMVDCLASDVASATGSFFGSIISTLNRQVGGAVRSLAPIASKWDILGAAAQAGAEAALTDLAIGAAACGVAKVVTKTRKADKGGGGCDFSNATVGGVGSGLIHPSELKFVQDSAKLHFTDKKFGTINDLAASLKSPGGDALAKSLKPVKIFKNNGELYTLDHRRVIAFGLADKMIPFVWATATEIAYAKFKKKFTTTPKQGCGKFITVR